MAGLDFELTCARCGGELRGAKPDSACPGCGELVSDTLDVGLIDAASGSVHTDVTCVACGYNLRTLRGDAACPECFTPVIESLRPDDLRLADSKWLRRVRSGLTCLLISAAGLLALPVLGFIIGAGGGLFIVGPIVMVGAFFLCWLLSIVGVFRANTSAPISRHYPALRGLRRGARILALCSILALGCLTPFTPVPAPFGNFAFLALGTVALLASFTLTLVSLRGLARRARRPGLARLSTVLFWTMISSQGAVMLMGLISALVMQQVMAGIVLPPGPTVGGGALGYAGSAGLPYATSSGYVAASITTPGYVGASPPAGTTTAPATLAVPTISPILQGIAAVVSCLVWPLLLGCYVVSLVVLFKYRGMLGTAIAQHRSAHLMPLPIPPPGRL